MVEIYCGNNRNNGKLLSRQEVIGDRYKCLRKGIGIGLNLPVDNDYVNYEPIVINEPINCSKSEKDGIKNGTITECLRKGIGIGKKIKKSSLNNLENSPEYINKNYSFYGILIIILIIFLLLYILYRRKKNNSKKDKKENGNEIKF